MTIFPAESARTLDPTEFMVLGTDRLAYTRPVHTDHGEMVGVFGADGSQLAVAPNRDVAVALILQNDLEPTSLH